MKTLAAFLLSCVILLPGAWFAVALDDWVGLSRTVVFEICFVALGIVAGALAIAIGRCKWLLLAPCVFIAFILVLPFIELSPVKAALRAVSDIQPGMTESEVRAVLDRHFPEHGRFHRPDIGPVRDDVLGFILDPKDGRYNAAIVRVKFSGGKCVSAEFLPD
jgi:hypothetical protein